MEIKGCEEGYILEFKSSGIAIPHRMYFNKWKELIDWISSHKGDFLEVYDSKDKG